MTATPYQKPVAALLKLGDGRGANVWLDYLGMGLTSADVPELIRMATDEDLNLAGSESREVWAPTHAWRALGQLKAEAAIEPLIGLLRYADDRQDNWVLEEIPKALGAIGPAAILPLRQYLMDPAHGPRAKVAAASALWKIGQRHPETRDECVAVLFQQMERYAENYEALNGELVYAFLELHAVEAAPVMFRAFEAGKVPLSCCGDWEEVQIELGLLDQRKTPARNWMLEGMNLSQEALDALEALRGIIKGKTPK